MEDHPGKKAPTADRDPEAAEIAAEIDDYLDERVEPDADAEEEAAAVIAAHDEDPGFREKVRRLGKALGLGD